MNSGKIYGCALNYSGWNCREFDCVGDADTYAQSYRSKHTRIIPKPRGLPYFAENFYLRQKLSVWPVCLNKFDIELMSERKARLDQSD